MSRKHEERTKSITGDYIGNAIGYCHCERHPGTLNYELGKKHKCMAKKCKHLEMYNVDSWQKKKGYVNRWQMEGRRK